MKVEFIESEFWGVALLVAEADFKLAKTKDAVRQLGSCYSRFCKSI